MGKECGLYLSSEKNGKLMLRKEPKSYEKWLVEKNEKTGMFSFKSFHGKYLSAGRGKPVADRKHKKDWENWRVVVVQDAKQNDDSSLSGASATLQKQSKIGKSVHERGDKLSELANKSENVKGSAKKLCDLAEQLANKGI